MMTLKINHNPDPHKKRKSLALIVYLDVRLLYLSLCDDNHLDNDFKPIETATTDSGKYHLVDNKVMDDFINYLINDYRMN